MTKSTAFLAVLCLGLLINFQTLAQDKRQLAKRHFDKGAAAMAEHNYGMALAQFKKAYRTSPHWMVLKHIGTCQAKLNLPAKAIDTMERFLAEGGGQVPADERQKAMELIDKQRKKVGALHLRIKPNGSEVKIDGESMGLSPHGPILLRSGSHHIYVILSNGEVEERDVNIIAGQEHTVRIPSEQVVIHPVAPAPAPTVIDYNRTAPPTAATQEDQPRWASEKKSKSEKADRPNGPSAAFYAMLGIMGAGVITGGVGWGFFAHYYESEQNYSNQLDRTLSRPPYTDAIDAGREFSWTTTCNSGDASGGTVPVGDELDEYYCNTEKKRRDYAEWSNTALIPAIVGTGVTVLAAGTAILFYFNPQWFDKSEKNAPSVSLLPVVTDTNTGLILTATF